MRELIRTLWGLGMIDKPLPPDGISAYPTIRKIVHLEGKIILGWTVTQTESDRMKSQLNDRIRTYLQVASANIVQDIDTARSYGYTYDDGTNVQPADIIDEIKFKNGLPFKEFEERRRAGEIMMSGYERYSFRVIRKAGFKSSTKNVYIAQLTVSALIEAGIFTEITDYFGKYGLIITGTDFGVAWNNPDVTVAQYQRENVSGAWVYPIFHDAGYFLNQARGFKPDRKSVVTKASAYANRRSLDILTAAAEMPKTIASALKGMAVIARMIKDFKKGEFNLSKAHKKRTDVMTSQHKKDSRYIQRRLNDKTLSEKQRSYWLRKSDNHNYRFRTALRQAAGELADELASLWLNFRYNIMPNVYLLQDIEKALARHEQEFITARSKSVAPIRFSGPGWSFDEEFITRCVIKRRFGDPSRHTAGGPQISADIFTTAWELVPLSFVVDWFLRIGDFLAAFSFKNDWDAEGNCLSDLLKINEVVNLFPDDSFTIDPTVRVDGFYYLRIIINPTDYIGLCWQPAIGLERKIDALALIWRPVRSSLKKR